MPAKAGIQEAHVLFPWTPAFAGVTILFRPSFLSLFPRSLIVMPAKAGIQGNNGVCLAGPRS